MMLGIDLIKIALGNKDRLDYYPQNNEWEDCFEFAQKQSVIGVLFNAVEKLHNSSDKPLISDILLMKWFGYKEIIQKRNAVVNERAVQLSKIFLKGGFRSCVLKGQGNALYYPNPSLRTSGDIDLWVDGERDAIADYVRSIGVDIHDIHLVHANAEFFYDVDVEVHFQPSCMFNPITEISLRSFLKEQRKYQFQLYDGNVGYAHPSTYFNLVYNLLHINRHVFEEGIGFRQLIDYYYILQASDSSQRGRAIKQIKKLRLEKFAASLMYVMQEALGLKNDKLLFKPNIRLGKRLLKDILAGGNFGKYGDYARTTTNDQRIKRGIDNINRNWQFVATYPEEVLWIPFFKVWHWGWRKVKGYL